MARETTPFVEHMAKLYNESTPKEQRALDEKLRRLKAGALASPHGVFHLFPALKAKTLKLAKPEVIVTPEGAPDAQLPEAPAASEPARGAQEPVEKVA